MNTKVPAESATFTARPGGFEYPPPTMKQMVFTMNFADDNLFSYYNTTRNAQDEEQVAGHSSLAAWREWATAIPKEMKGYSCLKEKQPSLRE